MFKVINGERPFKPSCNPPILEALWQYVDKYWTEDSAIKPATDIVVQQMRLNFTDRQTQYLKTQKSAPANLHRLPLKPLPPPPVLSPSMSTSVPPLVTLPPFESSWDLDMVMTAAPSDWPWKPSEVLGEQWQQATDIWIWPTVFDFSPLDSPTG
ncbi:hypothetical protein C8J57DRAFT_167191 [Mycena rebaudengoi]|nr:hypothetical protein C8J57DRAFT_167191 [Mycena rebaudengoi]